MKVLFSSLKPGQAFVNGKGRPGVRILLTKVASADQRDISLMNVAYTDTGAVGWQWHDDTVEIADPLPVAQPYTGGTAQMVEAHKKPFDFSSLASQMADGACEQR